MANVLRTLVCVAVLIPALNAQAPQPAPRQTFDVVSIKPTATGQYPQGMGSVMLTNPGGRFRAQNITAATLIAYTFKPTDRFLRPEQILGGPDWMRSTAFEITASTGTDISREELNLIAPALLRSMLEDRFKVKAHMETRSQPIFRLVTTRSDGRLGAQLRRTTTDCDVYERDQAANPQPRTFIPNAPLPPCSSSRVGAGKYSARGVTTQAIANSLSGFGRPVIDATGLTGRFDVDLEWVSEPARAGTATDAPVSDGPSIFTAVQEQLGLKLESSQEQRPVIVVDSIERPTPD